MPSDKSTESENNSTIIHGFGHTDQHSLVLNQVPFFWDLEKGNFSFFNSDAVILWSNQTLKHIFQPMVDEIGIDLFRLNIINAASQHIQTHHKIIRACEAQDFTEALTTWGESMSTLGWGKIEIKQYCPNKRTAVFHVDNPWELACQSDIDSNKQWGCPVLLGRIIGLLQKEFNCHLWARDEYEYLEGGDSRVKITVSECELSIPEKLEKARTKKLTYTEKLLSKEIEEKTAELKKSNAILENIANLDFLTNLNNRRSLEEKLLEIKNDHTWNNYVLVFVDLDQFKIVNDTCGHVAGDRLLTIVGETLTNIVDRDEHFVARYGGDEFTLLINNPDYQCAMSIANQIRKAISGIHFEWDGRAYQINCSIGFVQLKSIKSQQPDVAIIAADSACYQAKMNGRNQIYTSEKIDRQLEDRIAEMKWVHKIKEAIANDHFELHFQLIKPLHSDKHIALEALIRMVDDEGELIMPRHFLPAAENYDVIFDLDCWVINNVCKKLQRLGSYSESLESVAVNLSGNTVSNPKLEEFIDHCFKKYRVDAEKICFELTETHMMMNLDQAKSILSKLRKHGCSVSLDDFGAGMSSFGYLKELPVDKIKIDGSFVKNMDESMVDYTFVESITNVAKAMDIKTVAEFVENDRIVELLTDISVDYIQGYHVDRPRPWNSIFPIA
jgi:diguanylate cyclase (GGDEF)-like protein